MSGIDTSIKSGGNSGNQISQGFANLPMQQLIGAPFDAAISAQRTLIDVTIKFINEVCFVRKWRYATYGEEQGNVIASQYGKNFVVDKKTGNLIQEIDQSIPPEVIMLDFRFDAAAEGGGAGANLNISKVISVPLISVISIPTLAINSMSVEFSMTMDTSNSTRLDSSNTADRSNEFGIGASTPWGSSSSFSVSSHEYSHNASVSNVNNSSNASYTVSVSAEDTGVNEGMQIIIDALMKHAVHESVLNSAGGVGKKNDETSPDKDDPKSVAPKQQPKKGGDSELVIVDTAWMIPPDRWAKHPDNSQLPAGWLKNDGRKHLKPTNGNTNINLYKHQLSNFLVVDKDNGETQRVATGMWSEGVDAAKEFRLKNRLQSNVPGGSYMCRYQTLFLVPPEREVVEFQETRLGKLTFNHAAASAAEWVYPEIGDGKRPFGQLYPIELAPFDLGTSRITVKRALRDKVKSREYEENNHTIIPGPKLKLLGDERGINPINITKGSRLFEIGHNAYADFARPLDQKKTWPNRTNSQFVKATGFYDVVCTW